MSCVTNAILCVDILEPRLWLDRVNEQINDQADAGGQQFVDINTPEAWYGGTKCWEANTAVAAFNYFPPTAIAKAVAACQWEYPENVQLIVCDQDDEQFSILYPAANPPLELTA